MKKRFYLIALFVLFCHSAEAKVRVANGDTLEIDGVRVLLEGVSAPKYKQLCRDSQGEEYRCGKAAIKHLESLIEGKDVRCEKARMDKYDRELSVCYAGEANIGLEMIRAGWAVAYDRRNEALMKAEDEARAAKRGMWQGKFMRPEFYRALNPYKPREIPSKKQ